MSDHLPVACLCFLAGLSDDLEPKLSKVASAASQIAAFGESRNPWIPDGTIPMVEDFESIDQNVVHLIDSLEGSQVAGIRTPFCPASTHALDYIRGQRNSKKDEGVFVSLDELVLVMCEVWASVVGEVVGCHSVGLMVNVLTTMSGATLAGYFHNLQELQNASHYFNYCKGCVLHQKKLLQDAGTYDETDWQAEAIETPLCPGCATPEERVKDTWGRVCRQKKIQSRPRTRSYGMPEATERFMCMEQTVLPEGSVSTPEAHDPEAGIPDVKIQSSEMRDFEAAGSTEIESGILQNVGEAEMSVSLVEVEGRAGSRERLTECCHITSSLSRIMHWAQQCTAGSSSRDNLAREETDYAKSADENVMHGQNRKIGLSKTLT
ncbi:hypothetical protein K438DRAFT_1781380 [Mycena galopus ATCC 62051]|nr:hypothetical protein K438DRAFT_1781380 [Mycena galopus ATCC 62051]